ncbi:molybdopterin oxidoreductase, molybdopterin-binding subunit [Deferribacter desulfuricans SSM1]|uniref:Molybdopterin oxidoreductase, molybdopterin-binding subunit n=1 Tax=Deferribacter desulfuricans (strain DSM 14783 / JCM 11476 / NBRC 101012 / SSM1) TaxID=639282 RepID=D3P8W5_DEFDS|nr:molybdopterin-dependent oxidoreductase [Deferribacter desulfuricans]BAI81155.1 molybdopterin oxidoreductase, molybdopterin-binding subunit [Deferribacter desulfuricans SSM1]
MSLLKTKVTRRKFLGATSGAVAATLVASNFGVLKSVSASEEKSKSSKGRKFVPSTCAICVNKCGFIAEVNNGVIRKINPNPRYFKSRSMICARGNAGAKAPYDPDRLKKPLIRVGKRGEGKWKEVSWEEAYDYIVDNVVKLVKKYQNRSTIAFASTEGFQEEYFIDLANIIGTANTVRHPTLCLASNIQGYSSVFGTFPDADILNAEFVVISGSNRAEAIVTPDTIDMAKKHRDQTLVYIDPRATKTTALADKWYPIKPGTDLALVLAVIYVIINENLYDKEFVEKYTYGFDKLVEHVNKNQYTPEWAEKETEISAKEIYWLAREFAKHAPKSVWYPGRRSSFYTNDVYYRRACAILNAICGAWDKPGGLVPKSKIPLRKYEIEFPIFDWTRERIDAGKVPFLGDVLPEHDKTDAGLPTDSCQYLSEKDGSWIIFREAILKGVPYPVKGLFVYKQNPVESVPNRKKTLQMLEQMEFICTIDVAMSDTAWYSDVVLPESTYLERWDPVHSLNGIVPIAVMRQPVIEPLFDTKPMFEIMCNLAHRFMEREDFWEDTSEEDLEMFKETCLKRLTKNPVKDFAKYQVSQYPGAFEKLLKDGVFYLSDKPKYGKTLKDGFRFKTRTGKIEIYNVKYEEKGLYPLPVYSRHEDPKPGQFRFVVGRHGQFTHASTQNNPWLLEAYGDKENAVWINSKVAARMGIKAGDKVKVKSPVGEQIVKALPTEYIRPDVVFYVHGFGRLSKGLSHIYRVGASDAEIIKDYVDPISGNAAMHETFVTIEKI